MKLNKPIILDLNTENYNVIKLKQYDTGRILDIRILENGQTVDLTSHICTLSYIKADNNIGYISPLETSNLAGGVLLYQLTNNSLASIGKIEFEITIKKDTEIITTVIFIGEVGRTIRNDAAVESTSEFSALTIMENKVAKWDSEFTAIYPNIETKYTSRLTSLESIVLENLIENSNFSFGLDNWTTAASSSMQLSTLAGGYPAVKMFPNASTKTALYVEYGKRNLNLIKDKYYSLSFTVQGSADIAATDMAYNYIRDTVGGNKSLSTQFGYKFTTIPLNTTENRVIVTFKAADNYSNVGLIIGVTKTAFTADSFAIVTDVVFGLGKFAPSYTPSKADVLKAVDNKIATAKTEINTSISNGVNTTIVTLRDNSYSGNIYQAGDYTCTNKALKIMGQLVETNIGEIKSVTTTVIGQEVKEQYMGNGNYRVMIHESFTNPNTTSYIRSMVVPSIYTAIEQMSIQATANKNGNADALFASIGIEKTYKNGSNYNIELQLTNVYASTNKVYVNVSFIARH